MDDGRPMDMYRCTKQRLGESRENEGLASWTRTNDICALSEHVDENEQLELHFKIHSPSLEFLGHAEMKLSFCFEVQPFFNPACSACRSLGSSDLDLHLCLADEVKESLIEKCGVAASPHIDVELQANRNKV